MVIGPIGINLCETPAAVNVAKFFETNTERYFWSLHCNFNIATDQILWLDPEELSPEYSKVILLVHQSSVVILDSKGRDLISDDSNQNFLEKLYCLMKTIS